MSKELKTTTSGGVPATVRITSDRLVAYHRNGSGEPLMRINKWDKNNFDVDFEAGFQRGAIHGLTKNQIVRKIGKIEMYHGEPIESEEGFISWLGLDIDNPEHKEALKEFVGDIGRARARKKRNEVI